MAELTPTHNILTKEAGKMLEFCGCTCIIFDPGIIIALGLEWKSMQRMNH